MIVFSLLTQAADVPPMDLFAFIIALVREPAVVGLLSAVSVWLVWQTKRDLGRVEQRINGRMTELLTSKDEKVDAIGRAAHAEGALEVLKETAAAQPAPTAPPVIVVTPPAPTPGPSVPGGRRANDRPPPESDPTTHFP